MLKLPPCSRDQGRQGFTVLKLSMFHYKWEASVTSGKMETTRNFQVEDDLT